ncbi:hypothetical protein H8R18_01225 [Nanchangia anserum]|uniref:Uncharacterized protein n=1 Tax=Nanchangia anserum TaxID=2692125 RepID=A0A8I0KWC0_9ACTO|nr:hypothetical protein [Nanchangia anserum]MBD3689859.1 hypothetical protein [Nanchangia anserum]QOX82026.1 hypothetical protein H8R18_01225 [Nanchangia anserum]
MSRTRASAKKAGATFERAIADYLAARVDERIDRRVRNGVKDRGDISALRAPSGGRVVVECKDYGGRLLPAQWAGEAEIERGNDDALAGVVVAKRRGTRDPAQQWALMTLADLVAILTGERHPQ